jgi:hypothetical protein
LKATSWKRFWKQNRKHSKPFFDDFKFKKQKFKMKDDEETRETRKCLHQLQERVHKTSASADLLQIVEEANILTNNRPQEAVQDCRLLRSVTQKLRENVDHENGNLGGFTGLPEYVLP